MKKSIIIAVVFLLGISVGLFAARRGVDPGLYQGRSKEEAARSLLEVGRRQAGRGSWERIAVGRVYYLGGMKSEGEAIFDEVTSKRPEASDWLRIGRVYHEAGEWEKAKAAFDRVLKMAPKDAPWVAEIGSYYNLEGERERAEELFRRAFQLEGDEVWLTVNVAGSYAGVRPQ